MKTSLGPGDRTLNEWGRAYLFVPAPGGLPVQEKSRISVIGHIAPLTSANGRGDETGMDARRQTRRWNRDKLADGNQPWENSCPTHDSAERILMSTGCIALKPQLSLLERRKLTPAIREDQPF